MLIIEIHVDNHENKPASTRASNDREDVQTKLQRDDYRPIRSLKKAVKAWLEDRETKSSHSHGL